MEENESVVASVAEVLAEELGDGPEDDAVWYLPVARTLERAGLLRDDRYSTVLNQVGWLLANATGMVSDGDFSVEADPVAMVSELIAERDRLRAALGENT